MVERLTSVDICRGISIMGMVAADTPVLFSNSLIKLSAATLVPGFFLFVAGLSYELFIISRKERQKNTTIVNIETFWKAIILLAITQCIYFMGVFIFPSHFSLDFNSSMFFVIAMGYLIAMIVPNKLIYQIPLIIVPVLIANLINISNLGLLSVFLTSPAFPLIPFISFFFAGRGIMIIYENMNDLQMKNKKIGFFSAAFVALMVIIFQLFLIPITLTTRTEILGFLLIVGVMICILSLLSVYANRIKGYEYFLSPFESVGKIAFSVYYAFYAMELLFFPILNRVFLVHFDPVIRVLFYIMGIIIILFVVTKIEKAWRKFGYKFGFEWALRTGSTYLTKHTAKIFGLNG
jgi:hypothetical protein